MLRLCGPCVTMAVGLAACAAPSLGRQGTATQMLGPALPTYAPVPMPPRDTTVVALVGRFDAPFRREQVIAFLTWRGFAVRDEVTPDVNVVLVGEDPMHEDQDALVPVSSLPAYRAGVDQGARMVRLRAVRTQLEGYPDWLELRERLASLTERVTPEDALRAVASGAGHERLRGPDSSGCVRARADDWIAVRLDPGSPEPRQWDGMALFRGDTYLGELVVHEVWRGHALGRSLLLPHAALASEDRAAHRSERMQSSDGR